MKFLRIIIIASLLMAFTGGRAQAQSEMEQRFLKEMDALFQKGNEFYDAGYTLQSEWFYGQAIVGVRSYQYALARIAYKLVKDKEKAQDDAHDQALRAAVEEEPEEFDEDLNDIFGFDVNATLKGLKQFSKKGLELADKLEETADKLEQKVSEMGIDTDDTGRIEKKTWNNLASLSIVSPYPYFFDGVVKGYYEKSEEAKYAYACAINNPYMMRGRIDFTYLCVISLPELKDSWWRLEKKATEYLSQTNLQSFPFPRDYRNWSADYLVCEGAKLLETDGDASAALPYFDAAVRANPFDVDFFIAAAGAHLSMGDVNGGVYYINEGLMVDQNNSDLLEMAAEFK